MNNTIHAPKQQDGFAMMEVIIAAAIAAMVAIAITGGLSTALRGDRSIEQRALQLEEAQTIFARVTAGMDERQSLQGFEGWTLSFSPLAQDKRSSFRASLVHVTLHHTSSPNRKIETIIMVTSP